MAIEEILEIPAVEIPEDKKSSTARLERGGILSVIGKLSGKLRVAFAALGLLGGPEMGCAHKPIKVPPSIAQPERQICIVSLNEDEVHLILIEKLKEYLMTRGIF